MTHRFYKENGCWFIDLPHYPLSQADLAMVAGADVLLDKLSSNGDEIFLKISTKSFEGYTDCLDRVAKLGLTKGAIYSGNLVKINHTILGDNNLWLCPVTLFVFLRYPKKIYYKVVPQPNISIHLSPAY